MSVATTGCAPRGRLQAEKSKHSDAVQSGKLLGFFSMIYDCKSNLYNNSFKRLNFINILRLKFI